jgi:hypothetical protein
MDLLLGLQSVEHRRDQLDGSPAIPVFRSPLDPFAILIQSDGTAHMEKLFCPVNVARLEPNLFTLSQPNGESRQKVGLPIVCYRGCQG